LFADAGNGWLHTALRYNYLMPISCHFRYCKGLLVTSLIYHKSSGVKYAFDTDGRTDRHLDDS